MQPAMWSVEVFRATDSVCACPIKRVKRFALRAIRVNRYEETYDLAGLNRGKIKLFSP